MIDKRVPRVLNADLDARLSKPNELIDAYNIQVGTDYAGDNAENAAGPLATGDAGVIKPALGNQPTLAGPANDPVFDVTGIFDNTPNATGRRVIGQVSDGRLGIVYFFVYSTDPQEQGVYAVNNGTQTRVHTSSQYRFPSDGFVDAEVVHVSDGEGTFRPILYFTDNVNEPRRLDINAVYNIFTGEGTINNDTTMLTQDVITACPKTPIHPPTFEWINDATRLVSEFRKTRGLQFAFQCIYASGEETAPSTYSQVAIPPAYLQQGSSSTIDVDFYNALRITIPSQNAENPGPLVPNFTPQINRIRLLVREGETGTWTVAETFDLEEWGDVVYDYYHDEVLSGFPQVEQFKAYDSLPRQAETLAVAENRLMFGNYVEHYNEPNATAELTVNYRERPNDFVEIALTVVPRILPVFSDAVDASTVVTDRLVPQSGALSDSILNRRSGFEIRLDEVPSFIPSGTTINFSMSFNPANDVHIYDSEGSYHGSSVCGLGAYNESGPAASGEAPIDATIVPGWTNVTSPGYGAIPYGATNFGVLDLLNTTNWVTTDGPLAGTQDEVVVGCSAATPYVIKGELITFSFVLNVTVDLSDNIQAALLEAISRTLTGLTPSDDDSITVLSAAEVTPAYTYSYDLPEPVSDENSMDFGYRVLNTGGSVGSNREHNTLASKIVPCFLKESSGGTELDRPNPVGYFMVQQGYVQYALTRRNDFNALVQENSAFFFLDIVDHQVLEQFTCIPRFDYVLEAPTSWVLITPEQMQSDALPATFSSVTDFTGAFYLNPEGGIVANDAIPQEFQENLQRTLGYITLASNPLTSGAYSIMDGESGVRAKAASNRNVNVALVNNAGLVEISVLFEGFEEGTIFYGPTWPQMVFGMLNDAFLQTGVFEWGYTIPGSAYSDFVYAPDTNLELSINALGQADNSPFDVRYLDNTTRTYFPLWSYPQLGFENGGGIENFAPLYEFNETLLGSIPQFEIPSYAFFISENDTVGLYRSFKTSANHAFGVVYYDERGRPGDVNPLGSVYVGGYSNEERDIQLQGRAEVIINMTSDPPEWAHKYQIVYAGNNTVRSFRQFITGGAFVQSSSSDPNQNIYVSLNYLQDSHISYAQDFGAVDIDGTKQLYTFQPGDYLRVISYFIDEQTRVYPVNYIFEIVDQVILSSNPGENVLSSEDEIDTSVDLVRQGSFLVLRDNPLAVNFSVSAVLSGSNGPNSNTHGWNERCLVEIITPSDRTGEEERPYYEIGQPHLVGQNIAGQYYHEVPTMTLSEGDVYWRRVPQNIAPYDAFSQTFTNLLVDEDSTSRFRDYYVESDTFTDKYPLANWKGWGKPHFIKDQRNEVRRFSSITYSDINDYSTRRLSFGSFNHTTAPFRDFPNEAGNINRLISYNSGLFCVQEDQASFIPVERSIIQDAQGADTLVTSTKILGTQKVYPGGGGCDNNPESVIRIGSHIYWANKANYEIYKFNPKNGIQVISQRGVSSRVQSYFYDLPAGQSWRIPTGYDPLNDEFLITIVPQTAAALVGAGYTQPFVGVSIQLPGDIEGVIPTVPDIFVPGGGLPEDPDGPTPPDDEVFPDVPSTDLYNDVSDALANIQEYIQDRDKKGDSKVQFPVIRANLQAVGPLWQTFLTQTILNGELDFINFQVTNAINTIDDFASKLQGSLMSNIVLPGNAVALQAGSPGFWVSVPSYSTLIGVTDQEMESVKGVLVRIQPSGQLKFNISAELDKKFDQAILENEPFAVSTEYSNFLRAQVYDGYEEATALAGTFSAVDYADFMDRYTGIPLPTPQVYTSALDNDQGNNTILNTPTFAFWLGLWSNWYSDAAQRARVNIAKDLAVVGTLINNATTSLAAAIAEAQATATSSIILAILDQLDSSVQGLQTLNNDILGWNETQVYSVPFLSGSTPQEDKEAQGFYGGLDFDLNTASFTQIINSFQPVLAAAAQIDAYTQILQNPGSATATQSALRAELQAVNDAVDTLINQVASASSSLNDYSETELGGEANASFNLIPKRVGEFLNPDAPTLRNKVIYSGGNFIIDPSDLVTTPAILEPIRFFLEGNELEDVNLERIAEYLNAIPGINVPDAKSLIRRVTFPWIVDFDQNGAVGSGDLTEFLIFFGDLTSGDDPFILDTLQNY